MCGIIGALSPKARIGKDLFRQMRDTMAHRGPDGAGEWFSGNGQVAMGHRRLAIVDLSTAANQPFLSRDKKLALVFNGEIYNHAELRKNLIADGVKKTEWQTSHSDTETILMAYKKHGMPNALKHLRGMFAFGLWDAESETLYLARDRAGEKPLYYTILPDKTILFASEIKALIEHPKVEREVDEEALFHYLSFLMVPPPRTLFKGIYKLPAAHWAMVKPGKEPVVTRYWEPLRAAEKFAEKNELPNASDEAGWLKLLKPLINESVKLRQESSDVPVGVFLSGGIDSSTIAALTAKCNGNQKLHTFAIGPEGEYPTWPDETPHAEFMAKHIGSHHTTVRLRESDVLGTLPPFIHWQDEPVADPASMPLYFIAKAATDAGLKVCQGGEGGDELFVGYDDWMKFQKLEEWNSWPVPRFLKKIGYYVLVAAGYGNKFYAEYLRRASLGQPIFWGGAEAFTDWEKRLLLAPRLRKKFLHRSSFEVIEPIYTAFKKHTKKWQSFWNWCTYTELHLRLPEQLLMKADKMTMATALELRVPLLDHHLIAAALCTPPELRTKNGTKKYLLKHVMKGTVPDSILNRRKQGLLMPLREWVLSRYGPFAREILQDFCQRSGLLDWEAVDYLFRHQRGQHIWYLLNLALWWKHFIRQEAITPPA